MTSDLPKQRAYWNSYLSIWKANPELYALDVLGVRWWAQQAAAARAVARSRKVLVKASHSVGKTHLAGGLVNWFYDLFYPSITLTTAPTEQQVKDVLWKEVRLQRRGRAGLLPKAPRMQTGPNHFAVGYTAGNPDAFQGRHEESVLIIFDEATGISAQFWDAAEGMMTGAKNVHWLCILNPTDTASRAYQADTSGEWTSITISAMQHPNIAAELAGLPAPYPAAVRLDWLNDRIGTWCTPIAATDCAATDFEFPPGSGLWYTPGPLFEGRVLGRWPTQADCSVWSDAVWQRALTVQPLTRSPLEIGCDVARHGTDSTSVIVRRGACVLHHESHNGWNTSQTAGRLKELAGQYAQRGEPPLQVAIKIDDDGVGGGVTDQAAGYRFVGLSGAARANQPEDYPNRRSEIWFSTAHRADQGDVDLSRLPQRSLDLLRGQLMSPRWRVDAAGRRVVEPKDETRKRLGRSPDDADALNLAFAPSRRSARPVVGPALRGTAGLSLR